MARLRIRIELSRGGAGVPLHKLASVVEEAQKFFHMLAEDVHIEAQRGEWLGFDFDNQSLNFTAEYVGTVTPAQVQAFYAAFDGTTALRRATIGQFARITDAIGEDELVGFGLFQSERDAEPSEWRCLSRRDALRIAEEIQVLIGASSDQASHLPAVSDAQASLFGRRDEDPGLAARLARVEQKVDDHSAQLGDLRSQSAATEEGFRNLLSAVEGFCDQAAHQIERITPGSLPAARRGPLWIPRGWILAGIGGLVAAGVLFAALRAAWPTRSAEPAAAKAAPVAEPQPTPAPAPTPAPVPTPAPAQPMRIDLAASEPTWVTMTDGEGKRLYVGLLVPDASRTIEVADEAKLRTGNAGGLLVKLNGHPLGPIGPHGMVREIEFKDNGFTIVTPR